MMQQASEPAPLPEPMPEVLAEPSWAGRDQWREDAHVMLLCLTLENPNISKAELAEVLGIGGGRAVYLMRSMARMWRMKRRRFLIAENRWMYLQVISPIWMVAKVWETVTFLAARRVEFRALKAELKVLELQT